MAVFGPLRRPGVARAFGAALVGRLPSTAIGLLLLLRVRDLGGSYAVGGLAAGADAVAMGLSNPVIARLVDRRGQRRVLAACAVACAVVLGALAALPAGTPPVAVVALAAACGASLPPLSSAARALWGQVLDSRGRDAVLSLEATLQELTFIVGPLVLVTGLAAISTRVAFAAAAVLLLGGTAFYLASPLVGAWQAHGQAPRARAGALVSPGVRVMLGLGLAVGAAFGATELGMTAFAEAAGHRSAAGLLVAVWGAGSGLGGLLAARRAVGGDRPRRLAALLGAMAVADAAPALLAGVGAIPPSVAGLAVVGLAFFASGMFIAPGFALTYALLGDLAPRGTATEAFAWLGTGIGVGVAGGAGLAGVLEGVAGAGGAWALAAVTAAVGAGLVRCGVGALAPSRVEAARSGSALVPR